MKIQKNRQITLTQATCNTRANCFSIVNYGALENGVLFSIVFFTRSWYPKWFAYSMYINVYNIQLVQKIIITMLYLLICIPLFFIKYYCLLQIIQFNIFNKCVLWMFLKLVRVSRFISGVAPKSEGTCGELEHTTGYIPWIK